jgi:hypothetical protein
MMQRQAHPGMSFEESEQRAVTPGKRLLEDVVEIADGLVMMDAEQELERL